MEPDQIIDILKDYYSAKQEVWFGFLFGSYAYGRPKKTSDIDIGVYLHNPSAYSPRYKLDETVQLEDLLKKPVDLILMNEAPPLLTHEIFKHGMVFLDRDHAFLVEFRVANFYKYLDQRYIINHYFTANKAKIEGRNFDGQ
jgi:predicted nucleotidyltransferase